MKIVINKPVVFSKSAVETPSIVSVFPSAESASNENTLFVICDGAKSGALAKEASTYWTKNLVKALDQIDLERFGNDIFSHTIDQAAAGYFSEFDPNRKQTFRVGLTFMKLFDKGAYLASSQDCFICQIRRSEGTDYEYHSELMKESVDKDFKLNSFITNDIHPDDCFFLCNQACMKNLNLDLLHKILVEEGTDEQRMNHLAQQFSDPNGEYKAILFSIKAVNIPNVFVTEKQTYNLNSNYQGGSDKVIDVVNINNSDAEISDDNSLGDVNPDIGLHELKKPKFSKWMAFLIVLVIALIIWILIKMCGTEVIGNIEHTTIEFIKACCALG